MHPYDRFRERGYFGSLDGLRALSILAVLWYHACGYLHEGTLSFAGYYGVDLFFAISGFLITTLLLRERDRTGRIGLAAFYQRRSLRIFPLYYAVLALYVALAWLKKSDTPGGQEFFRNLPAYLTYTVNWFVDTDKTGTVFFFAWSLSVEEQFYLLWPSVEKFLPKPARYALLAALLGGSIWAGTAWIAAGQPHSLTLSIYRSLAFALLGGVALAHLLHHRRSFGWVWNALGSRAVGLALILPILAAAYFDVKNGFAVKALAVLLVGACVIREDHFLRPVLAWKPLAYLGKISYGIYLFHMLAVNVARDQLHLQGDLPLFAGSLAISVLVAGLSFRYFESYFLRWKTRLSAKPESIRLAAADRPAEIAPERAATL